MTFTANEIAFCRFTREAFTVVSCNGCVATLSDGTTRPVGELTRETPFRHDDESAGEYADRVERNEATAGRWFADATKPQLAAYRERIAVAAAYNGTPKWDRFREAAQREFKRTTAAAAELCNLTFVELMTAGEVSEALSYRWDELAIADAIGAEPAARPVLYQRDTATGDFNNSANFAPAFDRPHPPTAYLQYDRTWSGTDWFYRTAPDQPWQRCVALLAAE